MCNGRWITVTLELEVHMHVPSEGHAADFILFFSGITDYLDLNGLYSFAMCSSTFWTLAYMRGSHLLG